MSSYMMYLNLFLSLPYVFYVSPVNFCQHCSAACSTDRCRRDGGAAEFWSSLVKKDECWLCVGAVQ